jgi:hypothetical protein
VTISGFELLLEVTGFLNVSESNSDDSFPRLKLRRVWRFARIVLFEPLLPARIRSCFVETTQNGGGGIRNPKGLLTTSQQIPYKSAAKPLQNTTDKSVTDCAVEQNKTDSQQNDHTNLRQKCAICVPHLNSDLAEIARTWPDLPGHIKAAIKALIQTHEAEKK